MKKRIVKDNINNKRFPTRREFMRNSIGWLALACGVGLLALPSVARAAAGNTANVKSDVRSNSFFTIAVLPDTQMYCMSFPEIFTCQTQWIVAHKDEHKIAFVLHEGDITNNNNAAQWKRADTSLSILDGNVPYALAIGNHDIGDNGSANNRDTLFNDYFPVSRFQGLPTFGGVYEAGKMDNSYHLFSAGGTDWLILALEFGPRNPVLTWANQVVSNHPNRRVIVVTHTHLYSDETLHGSSPSHSWNPHSYGVDSQPGGTNDGVEVWNNFVRLHPNISFVFNGHVLNDGKARLVGTGNNGNSVYQMLSNYQCDINGGNGYLRLITFEPALNKVSVKTYSPYVNKYLTDEQNQFEFTGVDIGNPVP